MKRLIAKILAYQAKALLAKHKPKILGITGSVGKSSTKEAIAAVLETKFKIRKSKKSYNSELGLALAILGLETAWRSPIGWIKNIVSGFKEIWNKNFPEFLVLEMGVDRPKDFDSLLKIVKPSIAVITAIGQIPVHVEFFSGPEEVAKEKSKLVKNLHADGYAILNFDDEIVLEMKNNTRAKVITYGFGEGANIVASNYKVSLDGITFKMAYEGSIVPVKLNKVFGKQYIYSILAATAVGVIFNMNLIEIVQALQNFQPPPGRLREIAGIKQSIILDDSYNASPLATHAALDLLSELSVTLPSGKEGRKIFVFGDMLEIGRFTILAHQAVGEKAAKIADILITIGPRSKFTAGEAMAQGMKAKNVVNFSTSQEAAEFVKNIVKEGDIILVKGSQGIRTEKVVEELMAHPEEAPNLLARQEDYWKNK